MRVFNDINKLTIKTMKPIRLLLAYVLFFWCVTAFSQNIPVQVTGQVTDQLTQLPLANHLVAASTFPDSLGYNVPISDSTLTDASGLYSLTFIVPFNPGVASFFTVGTPDCTNTWIQQSFVYTGAPATYAANFAICNDSINPPSACENYIMPAGIQGLTAGFQGGLMNGLAASYSWSMGDGSTASGQYVTHTYAQQGIYTVVLQTVTPDGCTDVSDFTLVLMDSINPPPTGCENYIIGGGIQGLTASFQGNLVNGQPANYFWDLGDGSTATGQNVTHTYAQQGFYTVMLQTITPDSCMATSAYALFLGDTLNGGCSAYFMATQTANTTTMAFEAFSQNTNPMAYTWEFGDGTSGTGQNAVHTYCCIGTYMVQLVSSDNLGCTSVYTMPVVVFPDSTGTLEINGQVIGTNSIIYNAEVTLFGTDASGYYYPVQSTYVDPTGFYHFWNISEGSYLILASPLPDSLPSTQYLPTFYGNVIFWEQATQINLGTPQNPYNITLVSFDSIFGGNGFISGQLTGGGKSMLTGGQEVLLLDMMDTPVKLTYTDPQGNFSFASLPFGEYKVNPVVTGTTTQATTVNLNAANPSASVVMTMNGHLITGITKWGQTGLIESVYPNPAVSSISVSVKSAGAIKLQILDATGKLVRSLNETAPATGNRVSLPVSDLTPGLYILMVQDEKGNSSSSRFVKN
jgi:PKD repeat protein